jgi:excisionase family DNA binding protein
MVSTAVNDGRQGATMPGSVKVGGYEFDQVAYNRTDAAKLLGVSRPIMRQMIADHGVHTRRFGRLLMVPARELARLIDEQTDSSPDHAA